MIYKIQSEAVKTCRQDAEIIDSYFLSIGEVTTSYDFHDSKEKSRLEFYFDLLEKYQYPVGRIEFDIAVPFETAIRLIDIVVFKDDSRKTPYIAVDCLKDEISEKDFEKCIDDVVSKAKVLNANFAVCATRQKKRIIKLIKIDNVFSAKIIDSLPVGYKTED